MSDDGPPLESGDNLPEFTVSELSSAVKRTIEGSFEVVRVRGEVSGLKRHSSGHVYFTLKDDKAVLSAICWRGMAARLRFQPEDGLEVICTGRLTTYAGRSQYQIIVERVEPAGEGALLALLEARRKQLAAEGLFDEDRKQPLPYLPEVIGVITSPTGAVIRDILHRLADRFPRHVLMWPVRVQGDGAAGEVAAAIAGFNGLTAGGPVPRPDVIIVARGGGSLEDLWAFNEEVVVRATAASDIPLISAIGHETDVTLIDFAADRRAPTPTAAAEMAVPVRAELAMRLLELDRRLIGGATRFIDGLATEVRGLSRGLPDPRGLIEPATQRLDNASERLAQALRFWVERQRRRIPELRPGPLRTEIARRAATLDGLPPRLLQGLRRMLGEARRRIEAQARLLDGFGYEQVLARGFVLARDDAGHPVTSAAAATPGSGLALIFHDGERHATVDGAPARKKKPKPGKPPGDAQGSLL